MNIMDAAREIGLVASNGEVAGTIDQQKVLGALAELTNDDPAHADLYAAAAEHVRNSRSAGAETHGANSLHMRPGAAATTQLRYRSEMAEMFTDLAIDVGIRRSQQQHVAAAAADEFEPAFADS